MKLGLLLAALFAALPLFSQQTISGRITDEEQNPIVGVLVMNMKSSVQIVSDSQGNFTVSGSQNEEVRFVHKSYDRASLHFDSQNQRSVLITLYRPTVAIEEVEIKPVRLTGNLKTDSKNLSKIDPIEIVMQNVGVPKPPEKPREKPAEVSKDVLKPLLALAVKPEAIYDLISGDARRQKSLYRYEDLQDNIAWLRNRLDDEYFTEIGIPANRIKEFLLFSFSNPHLSDALKAKNLPKATMLIEEKVPEFLTRIQHK